MSTTGVSMSYEILGQLRVSGRPGVRTPRARKVETLLAVLLARANRTVSTDQLVVEIWGENPPGRASAAVHVYVSQLRALLRGRTAHPVPIATGTRGYSMLVDDGELDADRFFQLHEQGRTLYRDRSYDAAAGKLRQALDLWRGPVFGGFVDTPVVDAYVAHLEERRLECVELLMEVELLCGRHRDIVWQLFDLTKEHPLREPFYKYLMIALSRCNRRAEALEVFSVARRQLSEQLGVEPGHALRELHMSILTGDPCDAV
jgi:SARP family transcriptional regulator, regulator of embCAB operon